MSGAFQREECSDLALARRCAAGDEEAVRLVTAANNQRLFRAAWSILKDRPEAEDAVQSAYLKAFASVHSFEGRSSLSTWLTRIAINEAPGRACALGRTRGSRNCNARGLPPLLAAQRSARPPRAARDDRGRGHRAPRYFPHGVRAARCQGVSTEETAEALDVPVATVKTRLLRARRHLR